MLQKVLNKKIGKTELRVIDLSVVAVAVFLAVFIRIVFIRLQFPDYTICLKPWVETYKAYGGIPGLRYEIGNYTPAYMFFLMLISYFDMEPVYLIKMMGIFIDLALAFAVSRLIADGKENHQKILVFMVVLMLPTVIANSGVWGQCDNIYTLFIILALYCAVKDVSWEKEWRKKKICLYTDDIFMLLVGCAFAFKLQTIFMLPVIAVVFLKKQYRLRTVFWIPFIYFVTIIPSLMAGRSLFELMTIYFRQTQDFSELQLKFPNVYSFWQFVGMDREISTVCILLCAMSLILFVYYLYDKEISLDVRFVCVFTTFSVLFITYLLPHMHDRYAYVAEVTSVCYLIGKEKRVWIPILMNMIALESYSETLLWFSFTGFSVIGAILRLVLIVIIGRDIMKMAEGKA